MIEAPASTITRPQRSASQAKMVAHHAHRLLQQHRGSTSKMLRRASWVAYRTATPIEIDKQTGTTQAVNIHKTTPANLTERIGKRNVSIQKTKTRSTTPTNSMTTKLGEEAGKIRRRKVMHRSSMWSSSTQM